MPDGNPERNEAMEEYSNRETELDKIDASIQALGNRKEQAHKAIAIAKAVKWLTETDQWKLVIDETFIKQESDLIMKHMAGDEHLSDDDVTAMNNALKTIRGFRVFVKSCIKEEETAITVLKQADQAIKDELIYRAEVANGEIDLGDNDG